MASGRSLGAVVRRLEHEVERWRTEPMRAVVARARVQRPLRVRQFRSFGANSIVHRPVWLYGTDHIDVGANVLVLQGCWLAVERGAWDSDEAAMRLGDHVGVRVYCTISAAREVVLEDHVVLGASVTVIDSDHTWETGAPSVMASPLKSAPVRIGRGTWIGDRAAVLSGSDVGEQCIIGTNSVVKGRIPDYSIAVGSPARVVGSTR
jgi:lipopolysaccharide O-acetyltransferase